MKEKINYSLKNIFLARKRKVAQILKEDVMSFVYFTTVFFLTHVYSTCRGIKQYEAFQLEEKANSMVESVAGGQLLLFLSIIQIALLIVLVGVFLFGFSQIFLSLKKQFLIIQDELLTKILIGTSNRQITSEFLGESFIMLPVILVISLLVSNKLKRSITIEIEKMWNMEDILPFVENGSKGSIILVSLLLSFGLIVFCFLHFQKRIKKMDPTFLASNDL